MPTGASQILYPMADIFLSRKPNVMGNAIYRRGINVMEPYVFIFAVDNIDWFLVPQ